MGFSSGELSVIGASSWWGSPIIIPDREGFEIVSKCNLPCPSFAQISYRHALLT
jgi:hypothetical protein